MQEMEATEFCNISKKKKKEKKRKRFCTIRRKFENRGTLRWGFESTSGWVGCPVAVPNFFPVLIAACFPWLQSINSEQFIAEVHLEAQFTQDAEHLATRTCKLLKHCCQ